MRSHSDLHRRVTRLENDTESIYELLADLKGTQQEHTRRLDGIDTRLDAIDTRLDGIDTRLDGIDTRLDGIDQTLGGIQLTLAEVVRRLPEPLDEGSDRNG